jgi:translation initiation factor 4E
MPPTPVLPTSSTTNSTRIEKVEGDHDLQTPWCFWYDQKKTKKQVAEPAAYHNQLQKLATFDTVEGFWKIFCYLKRPSALDMNVNLYLFRDGKWPMWEAFPRGGCWILKVKKRRDSGASVLGKMWQELVIAMIGECFEEPDVVGMSICIRRNEDLISVWNVDNRNDDVRFAIGQTMKKILDLEPSTVIEYKHHAESMQDMSTFRNAKKYVFAASDSNSSSTDQK